MFCGSQTILSLCSPASALKHHSFQTHWKTRYKTSRVRTSKHYSTSKKWWYLVTMRNRKKRYITWLKRQASASSMLFLSRIVCRFSRHFLCFYRGIVVWSNQPQPEYQFSCLTAHNWWNNALLKEYSFISCSCKATKYTRSWGWLVKVSSNQPQTTIKQSQHTIIICKLSNVTAAWQLSYSIHVNLLRQISWNYCRVIWCKCTKSTAYRLKCICKGICPMLQSQVQTYQFYSLRQKYSSHNTNDIKNCCSNSTHS